MNTDDDWAELARELKVEKPAEPAPAAENHPHAGGESAEDAAGFASVGGDSPDEYAPGDSGTEEFDDAGEGAEAETEAGGDAGTGDGQPGTGRKRRRRRRRRKGAAAQPATAAVGPAEAGTPEPDAEPADAEGGYEPDAAADEVEYEGEAAAESEADAAEDAGGELLRELIATWNVPSWDEIVTGLHRPER